LSRPAVVCALFAVLAAGGFSSAMAGDEQKNDSKESKEKATKLTYEEHIKPILRDKCFSCHNADRKVAGLDLTTYTGTMQGGGSGEVIERGDARASYLYLVVNHEAEPFMPPIADKLAEPQLALIRDWIDAGALENDGSKPFV